MLWGWWRRRLSYVSMSAKFLSAKFSKPPPSLSDKLRCFTTETIALLIEILIRMDILFSSVYLLTSSLTKRVTIGLEYDNGVQRFVAILRLTGHDSNGVVFTREDWDELKSLFGDFTKFFCSYNQDFSEPHVVVGQKHTVDLLVSPTDRTIEIYASVDEVDSSKNHKRKKYIPRVIYKYNTFLNLKKLVKCIDGRFDFLTKIATHLDVLIEEFVKKLFAKIQFPQEAQYFSMEQRILESVDIDLDHDDLKSMQDFLNAEYHKEMSIEEISTIFYEFLCVKPDYLVFKYNSYFERSHKL